MVMGHAQIVFSGTPAALSATAEVRKEWVGVVNADATAAGRCGLAPTELHRRYQPTR